MIAETGQFDIIWEADQDEPPSLRFADFMRQLFEALDISGAQVAVLITGDRAIQTYNRTYRGKDKPTDVLSFPVAGPQGGTPRHLGDIVVSMDRVLAQAEDIGHGPQIELRFLILHGILHLLGYDHETDNGEMFARQTELKAQLAEFF